MAAPPQHRAGGFDGATAAVTGGASGIGAATARLLAGLGARVAVLDRDGAGAAAVADEVGGLAVAVDVADPAAVDEAFATVAAALGPVRHVVSNAGVGRYKPLAEVTDAEWRLLVGVNLTGAFNVLRAAIPHLRQAGGGTITHVASLNAQRAVPGEGPYSAAKAGVVNLTKTAALELAPAIRVNCVSPGLVLTPLTTPITEHPDLAAAVTGAVPAARFATAEEVAAAIAYLASDDAGFITGHDLVIDGGAGLLGATSDRIASAFGNSAPQPTELRET